MSGEGLYLLKSSWGLNISDNSDNDHLWAFDDGDGFDDFLLVKTGTRLGNFSDYVGHSSLESAAGGEMDFFSLVVLWELSDVTVVLVGSLSGEES